MVTTTNLPDNVRPCKVSNNSNDEAESNPKTVKNATNCIQHKLINCQLKKVQKNLNFQGPKTSEIW